MNEMSYEQLISIIIESKPDDWIYGDGNDFTFSDLNLCLIKDALEKIVPIEKLEQIS